MSEKPAAVVKRFVVPVGASSQRYAEQTAKVVAGLMPGPTPMADVVALCYVLDAVVQQLQARLSAVRRALAEQEGADHAQGRRHEPPPPAATKMLGAVSRKVEAVAGVLGALAEEAGRVFDGIDPRFEIKTTA